LLTLFGFYLAGGDGINARPGNFFDALLFSVQTMASIGYGAMRCTSYTNALVTVEALTGLMGLASGYWTDCSVLSTYSAK